MVLYYELVAQDWRVLVRPPHALQRHPAAADALETLEMWTGCLPCLHLSPVSVCVCVPAAAAAATSPHTLMSLFTD